MGHSGLLFGEMKQLSHGPPWAVWPEREGPVVLASMGRHSLGILFLTGWVGRAAKGPEWASMEGWGRGLREEGAEWGSVHRLTGSLRPRTNVDAKQEALRHRKH